MANRLLLQSLLTIAYGKNCAINSGQYLSFFVEFQLLPTPRLIYYDAHKAKHEIESDKLLVIRNYQLT